MSRDFKAHAPISTPNEVKPTSKQSKQPTNTPDEVGGPTAETDPTKFGDWSVNGRCVDF